MGSNLSSVSSAFIEESEPTHTGHPIEDDVTSVRDLFQTYLPLELINLILDFAEYWPCIRCDSNRKADVVAPSVGGSEATWLYLMSPPIPEPDGKHRKIRRVIFQTESRDQGWVNDPQIRGTYNDSWSWFEAMIFRASSSSCRLDPINLGVNYSSSDLKQLFPLPDPNGWLVQHNVVASNEPRSHTVIWTEFEDEAAHHNPSSLKGREGLGHELVRSLEPGDRVMLIAKARFPGWANHVSSGSIEIYYSL